MSKFLLYPFFVSFLVSTLPAEVTLDFGSNGGISPQGNPYWITLSELGDSSPLVSTSDVANELPAITGSLLDGDSTDGSFRIGIEGFNDLTSNWDGDTWAGGTSQVVAGNSSGLGLNDGSLARVNGGEAITWTFDLSSLTLNNNEYVALTGLDLDNSGAEFWQLAGTPGDSGAGTLVSTGSSWAGSILISDGDTFALAGDGRVRSMNLEIFVLGDADTPSNLVASAGVSQVTLDWDPDTSGALKNYNIYRSLSSPVSTAELLATTTQNSFFDTTAAIGVTYYYAVSATGSSTNESVLSNEVSATPVLPSPLQHLNATSISSSPVMVWPDDSGSGNEATGLIGSLFYPSNSLSSAGLAGVDFNATLSSVELFDAEGSDAWLDQSSSTNGFCILVAFKCDAVVPGQFNDLLGNSTDGLRGLQIGYSPTGQIQVRLNGTVLMASAAKVVAAGDTVILGLNYDAENELLELWESKNFAIESTAVVKEDFSNDNAVTLGSIDQPNQYLNGMVGELFIYSNSLSDSLFKEARENLLHLWIAPPNIIMLFVDDWSWNGTPILMDDRMSNSGFQGFNQMPNLERLAAQGMVFRNAYASPQCSPSRVALQTGQSNARNGFTVFLGRDSGYFDYSSFSGYPVIPCVADATIRPDALTIPEALDRMGYRSAHIGKWHMRGSPNDEGYVLHDGSTTNNEGNTLTNGDISTTDDPKLTGHITDSALSFIDNQVAAGKPFYAQLSYYAMHGGEECFPTTREMFQQMLIDDYNYYEEFGQNPNTIGRRRDPAVWLGMAYEMDQSFGAILDRLEELGIADNTYVVMMSDNGFRHGFFEDFGMTQPLHMQKWWVWQGGIRVPMVASGPGIEPGSYSVANVVNYDMMPTFYEWAGGNPDVLQDIDGVSLKSLMEGEELTQEFLNRSLYFHYPHYRTSLPHSCIIQGNDKVMYFYETPLLFGGQDPIMLFDIGSDPGEFTNVYADNPVRGDELYNDLMSYLDSVNARIPLLNLESEYDALDVDALPESLADLPTDWEFYNPDTHFVTDEYSRSMNSGFFTGTRQARGDELLLTFLDYWMRNWGVDIGGEGNDFDGDGRSNLLEYSLGGNPVQISDGSAYIRVWPDGSNFKYSFNRRNDDTNLAYKIQTSDNLVDWTNVVGSIETTKQASTEIEKVTVTLPAEAQSTFVRVEVTNN